MLSPSTPSRSKPPRFTRQLMRAEELLQLDPERHQIWLLRVNAEHMESTWLMGRSVLDPREEVLPEEDGESNFVKLLRPAVTIEKQSINVVCPDKNNQMKAISLRCEGQVHFEANIDEICPPNQVVQAQSRHERVPVIEEKERHPLLLPQEVAARLKKRSKKDKGKEKKKHKEKKSKKGK